MDVQNGRSSGAVSTEGTAIGWAAYRPVIMLLVAVPLSCASWLLIERTPNSRLPVKFDANSEFVYWEVSTPAVPNSIRKIAVESGEISGGTLADVTRYGLDSNSDIVRFECREPAAPASREPPVVRFIDPTTLADRVRQLPIEMDAPIRNGRPIRLVGGRYAVFSSADRVHSLDLHDPRSTLQEYSTTAVEGPSNIFGSESDILFHDRSGQFGATKSVEIYRVDAGAINRVVTLPTISASIVAGNLATLRADRQCVELRNVGDYSLVKSVAIDKQFCASHYLESLEGSWVCGVEKRAGHMNYFSVLQQKTILSPEPSWRPWLLSNDQRFLCLRNPAKRNEWLVFDSKFERVAAKSSIRPRSARFLPDNRLAVAHSHMGATVAIYNLETGTTLRYVPFLWCAILQPIVLLSWFVWLVNWVKIAANSLSCLALTIFFPVLFVAFVGLSGSPLLRFSLLFSQPTTIAAIYFGWFIGAIACSGLLGGLAESRFRLLWPLAVFSAMTWGQTRQIDPWRAEPGLSDFTHVRLMVLTIMSAAVAIGSGWMLRAFGTRLSTLKHSTDSGPRKSPVLRNYFVWIAAFALMLSASRRLWTSPSLWSVFQIGSLWLPLFGFATLACIAIASVTLTRRKQWLGTLMATAAWLVMVYSEVAYFAGDLMPSPPIGRRLTVVAAMACASTYAIALSLRLRGWTIGRQNRASVSLR